MNKDINYNKIENIVNEFIKQIYQLDKSKKTLDDKINSIDILINNLIDLCIKKKIFYYVENKISYSNIVLNFKTFLIKFIKKLVDPSDNIINKYIILNNKNLNNTNLNWDNVSDINSLMFKNFKQLNETFEKNVSFNEEEGFEFNTKSNINSKLVKIVENENENQEIYDDENNVNNENISFEIDTKSNINLKLMKLVETENNTTDNLSLYIKILINQNKYLVEFVDKLIYMCKILSDTEIKYKKLNPYN